MRHFLLTLTATPEPILATASIALIIPLLAIASLCAILDRGRPFTTGFAIFGWTYSVLSWSYLLMADLDNRAPHPVKVVLECLVPYLFARDFRTVGRVSYDYDESSYQTIGHCVICLMFATLGALLARALDRRRENLGPAR